MTKSVQAAVFATFLTVWAVRADAQITTVIAPPKPAAQKQVEVARRQEAARDSVARVTLTDMKAWVDSAAASLALRPDTAGAPADTGVAAPQPPSAPRDAPSTRNDRRADSTAAEFRAGARAPDTATSVPTLAVTGGLLILLGFALRRRRAESCVRTGR